MTTKLPTNLKDLYYPNVLTPSMQLNPSKVQDSIRRIYDLLYEIQPPAGSNEQSSILDLPVTPQTGGTITGYVEFVDANGTTRKLAIIS